MRKYFPAWPRPRFAVGKITLRLGNFQLILIELFCWWKLALWWDLVGIIFTSRRDNFSHMNSPLQAFGKGNLKRYRHECSPLNLLHIFRTPFLRAHLTGFCSLNWSDLLISAKLLYISHYEIETSWTIFFTQFIYPYIPQLWLKIVP